LPAWVARTEHVPDTFATKLNVVPLTVQIDVVSEAKITVLPEAPPLAVSVTAAAFTLTVDGGLKTIVCPAGEMVTESVAGGAALYVVSPAWLATILHVPAFSVVTVAPLVPPVVHVAVVALAKLTRLLEAPPVALTVNVPLGENITGPGFVPKLMF